VRLLDDEAFLRIVVFGFFGLRKDRYASSLSFASLGLFIGFRRGRRIGAGLARLPENYAMEEQRQKQQWQQETTHCLIVMPGSAYPKNATWLATTANIYTVKSAIRIAFFRFPVAKP
jgi:hypothetical protein